MVYSSKYKPLEFPKCNVLSFLFPRGQHLSSKPLWIDADDPATSLSPNEMLSKIKSFAVGLDKLGVGQGETIAVFSPNNIFIPVSLNRFSHDHTASLLQLIENLRQNRINHLLDLILVARTLLLLLLLLLLLRTGILLLLLLMRVSIGTRRMLLMLRVLLIVRMIGRWRSLHIRRSTSQIHINAPCVLLSRVLETEFLADLFYSGLDFLDMIGGVVAFADNSIDWGKL